MDKTAWCVASCRFSLPKTLRLTCFCLEVLVTFWLNEGMSLPHRIFLFIGGLLCVANPFAAAQFDFGMPDKPAVGVTTEASAESYKAGTSFFIEAKVDIESPWHAYYENPGTVGMPMTVTLKTPEGFDVVSERCSPPVREESEIGVAYVFKKPVIVWQVKAGDQVPDEATFQISFSWQLCRDGQCLMPEEKNVSLTLKRGNGEVSEKGADIEAAVAELPLSEKVTAKEDGNKITLSFRLPQDAPVPKDVYFFSSNNVIFPMAEQVVTNCGQGSYELTMEKNTGKDAMYPVEDELIKTPLKKLSGLLVADGRSVSIDATVEATSSLSQQAEENETAESPAILYIFVMLFLGGMILNLMPCVFPVIGLKIMGFVRLGGGERRKVWEHSAAFAAGILISFWVLTGLLVYLSALTPGVTHSWAEWMQNVWVVYILMLVMLVMAMSMCGVFEMGVSATGAGSNLQSKSGLVGSFFSGLLATVVATPCSAPFLGSVMVFAMQLPPVMLFAAMTCMALGLASPYLVLGIFPSLVRFLPKPGAWMESLKQGLGFLLFAAVAWLLSVYLSFIPEEHSFDISWILMSLVLFSAACWVYGRWCPIYRSRRTRFIGLCVAVAIAVLGVWGSQPASFVEDDSALTAEPSNELTWEPWSEEAVQEALNEGRPVYVDFTAKWCMTCLSNKKIAYTDDVKILLKEKDVLLLRADKTRPDPAIDAAMRKLNRSSIPVNVLYMPDKEPMITAELLTPSYLYGFLKERLSEK